MNKTWVKNFYLMVTLILISINSSNATNFLPEHSKSIGHLKYVNKQFTGEIMNRGTGFLISSDGYILTNEHVVEDYDPNDSGLLYNLTITFDGRTEYIVKEVYTSPETDIAVLKINVQDMPYIDLTNSNKSVDIGEPIFSVGFPLILGKTVTKGIISGNDKTIGSDSIRYLLSDVVINRGNSGGPIFDSNGSFVGISSALHTANGYYMGYSYIIPSDVVEYVSNQLMLFKKHERSSFGVVIRNLQPFIDENTIKFQSGVYVHRVNPNSAAAKGGLLANDVILTLNGERTHETFDLSSMLLKTKPNDIITLGILRDGLFMEKKVKLSKRIPVMKAEAYN